MAKRNERKRSNAPAGKAFPAELNAVALLMCAPSELNQLWVRSGSARGLPRKAAELLDKLPLSARAKADARSAMMAIEPGDRAHFAAVADVMRTFLWQGEEPHPDGPQARSVIRKIREIDRA